MDKKKLSTGILLVAAGAVAVSTVVVFAAGGGPGGGPDGGMGGGNMGSGQVEMSESVIQVKLQTPETGSLSRTTDFIGKIEPSESVNVYPEISGKVSAVYFEAGDTVQAGDLLFTLDDSDAALSYEMAQASYEQKVISADTTLGSNYESKLLSAKAQLNSAQQSLNNARLKLKDYNDGYDDSLINAEKRRDEAETAMKAAEQAYADAKNDPDTDEDTLKNLLEEFTKAEQEYLLLRSEINELEDSEDSEARDLRSSYKNAQTNYQQALENYNLLLGGSLEDTQRATEAELKSAQLSLEQSAATLDKYKVYSPISGVIETKSVTPYEMASTGTAAYTISNKNTMSVKFNASADAAVALSLGDEVTLTKSATEYTAVITSIDTKADESTGLFPIEAQIQDADGSLLSGVSVKVTAATQKAENAMLIPIDVIYYDEGQPYVFTYSDGTARRTDIVTGMASSAEVVVESGLDMNSQIITTWHPDLKDGVSVTLADGQADLEASQSVSDTDNEAPAGAAVLADSASLMDGVSTDSSIPADNASFASPSGNASADDVSSDTESGDGPADSTPSAANGANAPGQEG